MVKDSEEPSQTPREGDGIFTSSKPSQDLRQVEESVPIDIELTEQRSGSDVGREEPLPSPREGNEIFNSKKTFWIQDRMEMVASWKLFIQWRGHLDLTAEARIV